MTIDDATINELVSALRTRCPDGVICVRIPDDGNQTNPTVFFWGNGATCIGLATILAHGVTDRVLDACDDEPDDA